MPSSPTNPYVIGKLALSNGGNGLVVSGTTAYVSNPGSSFTSIDVTDPTQPKILKTVVTHGGGFGIALSGSTLFVSHSIDGIIDVYDVTAPSNPVLLGEVTTGHPANGIALSGSTLYVAAGQFGLDVVNVATPTVPTLVTTLATGLYAQDVSVFNGYAYVADRTLTVVDVQQPTAPVVVSSWRAKELGTGRGDYGWHVSNFTEAGVDYAVVQDGFLGNRLLNVQNPKRPVWVATYEMPYASYSAVVNDGLMYVGAAANGFHYVDITRIVRPLAVRIKVTKGSVALPLPSGTTKSVRPFGSAATAAWKVQACLGEKTCTVFVGLLTDGTQRTAVVTYDPKGKLLQNIKPFSRAPGGVTAYWHYSPSSDGLYLVLTPKKAGLNAVIYGLSKTGLTLVQSLDRVPGSTTVTAVYGSVATDDHSESVLATAFKGSGIGPSFWIYNAKTKIFTRSTKITWQKMVKVVGSTIVLK